MGLTITEALAEIKTINKRIEKKREFVLHYLYRQEGLKDPLEKDGGSVDVIARERQGIADLEARIVTLRRGIQRANDTTMVTINGMSNTIGDWLTWRRDVAPNMQGFMSMIRQRLAMMRDQAKRGGSAVIQQNVVSPDTKPTDYIVNVDEADLAKEIEALEDTLGQLDGQLSLKNATIMIE